MATVECAEGGLAEGALLHEVVALPHVAGGAGGAFPFVRNLELFLAHTIAETVVTTREEKGTGSHFFDNFLSA